MSAHEGPCVPYPTKPGTCVKCGREIAEPQPDAQPRGRDRQFEHEFLGDAVALAEKLANLRWDGYPRNVLRRLDGVGDRDYGDATFLTRDNLPELLDETPDLGSWSVLEAQRIRADGSVTDDEYHHDLMHLKAIAAYGALTDFHAQQIVRHRHGLD